MLDDVVTPSAFLVTVKIKDALCTAAILDGLVVVRCVLR
jgi:hypothetical protein